MINAFFSFILYAVEQSNMTVATTCSDFSFMTSIECYGSMYLSTMPYFQWGLESVHEPMSRSAKERPGVNTKVEVGSYWCGFRVKREDSLLVSFKV